MARSIFSVKCRNWEGSMTFLCREQIPKKNWVDGSYTPSPQNVHLYSSRGQVYLDHPPPSSSTTSSSLVLAQHYIISHKDDNNNNNDNDNDNNNSLENLLLAIEMKATKAQFLYWQTVEGEDVSILRAFRGCSWRLTTLSRISSLDQHHDDVNIWQ